MNKKAIGFLLVLGLATVLGACGGAETEAPAPDAVPPAETPADAPPSP